MTHVPTSRRPAVLVSCGWWRPRSRACAASLRSPQDRVIPWPCSAQTPGSWWWGTVTRAGSQGRSPSLRGAGAAPWYQPPRQGPARRPRVQWPAKLCYCFIFFLLKNVKYNAVDGAERRRQKAEKRHRCENRNLAFPPKPAPLPPRQGRWSCPLPTGDLGARSALPSASLDQARDSRLCASVCGVPGYAPAWARWASRNV